MLYNIKDFTKELNIYNTIEFKKLDNFDNYFIFEDGRVFSLNRKRFLKTSDRCGYCFIRLYDNNKKQKDIFVHRLVYETFKGKIPEGLQVDHINGIRDDNRLINLRLLTNKENSQNRHYLEQYREVDKKNYLRKKDYNKQYFKGYKEKHREEIKQYKKDYYEKHKEERRKSDKKYREENREKRINYLRDYYEQNQEKIKKYREEHKEAIKQYKKEYYEKNKEEINRKRREKYILNKMNKMN